LIPLRKGIQHYENGRGVSNGNARMHAKLIAPVASSCFEGQDLILSEKESDGTLKKRTIEKVLYVPLKGKYGFRRLE